MQAKGVIMYQTIEADIENGVICSPESSRLPAHAHVLITLLPDLSVSRPAFGTETSTKVETTADAFAPLSDEELLDWGLQ